MGGPFHFTSMVDGSGIDFVHVSGTSDQKPFPAANGSGVAVFDYDRDGWPDLYFATGTPFPLDPHRIDPTSCLFRNQTHWRFDDVTDPAGAGHNGFSAGLAVGDYDNDGWPDLYLNCYGENRLYRNQGDGTFEDVSEFSGTNDSRWGTSAAFLDVDADGLLDLYVGNYAKWTPETNRFCGDEGRGMRMFCSPATVMPERDVLFQNSGNGTFNDISEPSGISTRVARTQGVIAADFNDDLRIDLYLGNDLNANSLFLNLGSQFRDATELSGVGYDRLGKVQAGMGVAVGDPDRNGDPDLFVTNFANEHNAFYRCVGPEMFQDVADTIGLAAESLPHVGWGTEFVDVDLDGWADLVVTNGHVDDNLHEFGREGEYAQPALLFQNRSGRFERVVNAGDYFDEPSVGRGLATGDLDCDGDMDLVITHQDASPALLRNDSRTLRSLCLKLIGTSDSRSAIGARIVVHHEDGLQTLTLHGGGSYLSASESLLMVAMPPGIDELPVIVTWPDGDTTRLVAGRGVSIVVQGRGLFGTTTAAPNARQSR